MALITLLPQFFFLVKFSPDLSSNLSLSCRHIKTHQVHSKALSLVNPRPPLLHTTKVFRRRIAAAAAAAAAVARAAQRARLDGGSAVETKPKTHGDRRGARRVPGLAALQGRVRVPQARPLWRRHRWRPQRARCGGHRRGRAPAARARAADDHSRRLQRQWHRRRCQRRAGPRGGRVSHQEPPRAQPVHAHRRAADGRARARRRVAVGAVPRDSPRDDRLRARVVARRARAAAARRRGRGRRGGRRRGRARPGGGVCRGGRAGHRGAPRPLPGAPWPLRRGGRGRRRFGCIVVISGGGGRAVPLIPARRRARADARLPPAPGELADGRLEGRRRAPLPDPRDGRELAGEGSLLVVVVWGKCPLLLQRFRSAAHPLPLYMFVARLAKRNAQTDAQPQHRPFAPQHDLGARQGADEGGGRGRRRDHF